MFVRLHVNIVHCVFMNTDLIVNADSMWKLWINWIWQTTQTWMSLIHLQCYPNQYVPLDLQQCPLTTLSWAVDARLTWNFSFHKSSLFLRSNWICNFLPITFQIPLELLLIMTVHNYIGGHKIFFLKLQRCWRFYKLFSGCT